jgi:serine phosphatase RsbU (regulator of sigma subunit)
MKTGARFAALPGKRTVRPEDGEYSNYGVSAAKPQAEGRWEPVNDDDFFPRTLRVDPGLLRGEPSAQEELGHYLVLISGGEPGKHILISETAITIGRNPDQTLVIADTSVSRRHAQMSIVNGELHVTDLGSTNGTFVDGVRLSAPQKVDDGSVIKVGDQLLRYERRGKDEIRRREELDRELARASEYVLSLLPAPVIEGTVHVEWRFVPSAQLGGDAFGYYWLDRNTFVLFMIDVSGHGAGAAMHSVAVVNALRQRALPGVDWRDPAQVLAGLNDRFQMDQYNGMLFTMWYGVYDAGSRMLMYSAAGHHPAYLVRSGRELALPLGIKSLMLGAAPESTYPVERTPVHAGSALYLFSDGAFEITTGTAVRWTLNDFVPLITAPPVDGTPEPERLMRAVRRSAAPGVLEDDCSIVVATFL